MLLFNYIKLTWRNICKRKLYSIINIGGLAAGLCVCMLIMLYVAHELSYDRFHKDSSRIFSLVQRMKMEHDTLQLDCFNYATGPAIANQDAAVTSFVRMGKLSSEPALIQNIGNPAIRDEEAAIWFTDANYFSFFSFVLLEGDTATVLQQPFTAVISASMAKKYFGNEDAVGKQLRYNDQYIFVVSGVMADAPSNSSIKADFLLSNASAAGMQETRPAVTQQETFGGSFRLYLKLDDAANVPAVAQHIDQLSASKREPGRAVLTPLTDKHQESYFGDGSTLRYLKLFPLVAALILLMALINYMSLSTARATVRAKEIGVRKVMGADHKGIARQFYVESALYAILAFILGIGLYLLLRNWFFNLLELKIDSSFLYHPMVITIYAVLLLITIVAAGSYPSFVLSRYNPITVLSGKMSPVSGGGKVRKVLTVLQFGTAAALIICSVVINRQLYFFRHTATGIDKENVLVLPFRSSIGTHYQAYRQQVGGLKGVSQTGTVRYSFYSGMYSIWFVGGDEGRPPRGLPQLEVDESLIRLAGLQWKTPPADMNQLGVDGTIVLNEKAAEDFNLTPSPIGKTLNMGNRKVEVIGIIKNFHFKSLHEAMSPLALAVCKSDSPKWGAGGPGCLYVKVAARQNIPALVQQIKEIYAHYDAQTPFQYSFLDDEFGRMYTAEDHLSTIFGGFTVLTILIAALGLLGLAAFSTEQRMREIGIRKVLGASVTQITTLLSKDFIKLILISLVMAAPVAWYLMQQWLQQFAYRVDMQPWMFVLPAFIVAGAALAAIGIQTLKAAISNPVISLKRE
ncbi:ABC transporter permease [Chitinophaga eiseniae]|uniref:FtsX-like permease family protein n=1 Tax=Chitinophaga eiseniae TaxID=634771 RepID=A0A847SM33_9BACT|nr:ABC transporter permease [Chitinophaga eiseniae]NLR78718.1 FtsX-like permease family protein [Chitinophaga eiseniae]